MHWSEQYLGKPWVRGGRGPNSFDCWGFVKAVYRDGLGVELQDYPTERAGVVSLAFAIRGAASGPLWSEVETPDEFDGISICSPRGVAHHVGIWTCADGGRVIHCNEGVGVVAVPRNRLEAHGLPKLRFYRHADNR